MNTEGWSLQKLLINAGELLDELELGDEVTDKVEEKVIKLFKEAYCAQLGHEVQPDHCNRPEHNFCIICMEKRPGEAKRSGPSIKHG